MHERELKSNVCLLSRSKRVLPLHLCARYASAFHYLSASINLKSDFPSSYMYLAVTLSRLEDLENACSAYEKAIEMERCVLGAGHGVVLAAVGWCTYRRPSAPVALGPCPH